MNPSEMKTTLGGNLHLEENVPMNIPTKDTAEMKRSNYEFNLSCSTLVVETDVEMSTSIQSVKEITKMPENKIENIEAMETLGDIGDSSMTYSGSFKETPLDRVILPEGNTLLHEQRNLLDTSTLNNTEFRHGISRYAPYGTRFAARMKDGEFKTSHIAGDLANRARQKNGRGSRVDLILVTHEGERNQLDVALAFYESQVTCGNIKPGPSEVLNHMKELGCDWDYRKGDGVKLLQRNASNFFKRMMEHARRISHPLAQQVVFQPKVIIPRITVPAKNAIESDVSEAAAILESLIYAKQDNYETCSDTNENTLESSTSETVYSTSTYFSSETETLWNSKKRKRQVEWGLPKHHKGSFFYQLCKHASVSRKEENDFYSKAAESFDWESVPKESMQVSPYDCESWDSEDYIPVFQPRLKKVCRFPKSPKVAVPREPKPVRSYSPPPPADTFSVISENPKPVIRKGREGPSQGLLIKGLSRHSPYGTRFCAKMPNGEMRESFLAGDLADRARSADGKSQGELILVLHPGEIKQLEVAWEFLQTQNNAQLGAGVVLEYLRSLDLDFNHRKAATRLLQKNAGNFFKRVQEYGRRKQLDPYYLSSN